MAVLEAGITVGIVRARNSAVMAAKARDEGTVNQTLAEALARGR
jgi:hypothetical protein